MSRRKKTVVPIELVELEPENYHIVVHSVFPNGECKTWVVDTGASRSVFDINLREHYTLIHCENTEIQSAGIGSAQISTQLGTIDLLHLGDFELHNLPIALIDLDHVNNIYSSFSNFAIAGLLGSDLLVKYKAEINYKKLTLSFYSS